MLEVRLARLALPLPLELSIRRALVFPERSAQHEGLVLSWELAARILAGSMWAACRELGATSPALETATKNLDRPSFGHWAELTRACEPILRGRSEPAAAAFRGTLAGLESPLPDQGGLRQLAERIAALPAKNAPKPRRVQELLDSLPFYRNAAQSTHGDVPPRFREESVAALLEGLIDFCERVPLTGSLTLVYVRRLERTATGHVADIARLTGNSVSWSTRTLDEALWTKLAPARPYLFHEPDLVIPLFPMAAVSSSGAEWHVGWYARQVHTPTVMYQGVAGTEFQLALAPDDLRALVQQASSTSEAVSQAALALDPYRGLLSYDEEHAAIFHGREEETESAAARIQERGTLLVFGASGSGKSSWLKAGVLPALRSRAALAGRPLRAIVMVPGDRPIVALRRALTQARGGTPEEAVRWARVVEEALPDPKRGAGAPAHENALAHVLRGFVALGETPALIVDQLEETVAASVDPVEARAFLSMLTNAAASAAEVGAIVLATVRADLLGPLIEHAGVRRWLETDGAPIGSIPPERLTRVIVDPLRGRKVRVEPGLAEMIVADVESEPGALALLSQVLTTLWDERSAHGYHLTKQGYVDAGRVAGALERQAEAALAEVRSASPEGRASIAGAVTAEKQIDRLFLALAQTDEGQRFTRRRLALSSLASELVLSDVGLRARIRPFVERRLIVLGGDGENTTVEVAHERLLDAWPRLKNLLATEREVLELRRDVERASERWGKTGGRGERWVDSTLMLERSEQLVAEGRLDLDERGKAFLRASRTAKQRRRRIERTAVGLILLLAVGALIAAFVATRATHRAQQQEQVATQRAADLAVATETAQAKERDAARNLNDVLSLSAVQDLKDLEARADALWPADPENVPKYEAWLADARVLVEGRPAVGVQKAKASLAEHEAKLAEIRRLAKPLTPQQVDDDRKASPSYAEWEKASGQLQWMRRMLGEEPWPVEAEVEAALTQENLPTDANGLNDIAWKLVDIDPAKIVYGSEIRGLILATRAVAAAKDTERGGIRDTLGWALFRCGRFDQALVEEQQAVEEVQGKQKGELAGSLKQLQDQIALWNGEGARSKRSESASKLSARVAELQKSVDERRTYAFEDSESNWWHVQLSKVVSDLRLFTDEKSGGLYSSGTSETHGWGIVKRAAFARTIEDRSVSGAEAQRRWDEAITAIAASPKYGGLKQTPQVGLLPIGADPDSGLWEFWHVQSGEEPKRGTDGKLILTEKMGIVLVLIPGGTFWMGAQSKNKSGPNYDPQALANESPVHEVTLSPYFLSKYEMTQGQWHRFTGRNPSAYGPSEKFNGHQHDLTHPVEQVSWTQCMEVMSRLGLALPSEAKWEFGSRGGMGTPWWTGAERESLRGKVNIADQTAARANASWAEIKDWPDLEDGWAVHAPVGSLAANPFGLHEVLGNVWEWCRDGYSKYYTAGKQVDPLAPWRGAPSRVVRGGSFNDDASHARLAERIDNTPESRFARLGLRPSRASRLPASLPSQK